MNMEDRITAFLELYPLEEAFENLDIEPSRVIEILLDGGYVCLPPYLDDYGSEQEQEESYET